MTVDYLIDYYHTQGKYVSVNDHQLYYVQIGQGKPVVLLHGLGDTCQNFIITILLHGDLNQYQYIAFDRPGFGKSNRVSDTMSSPIEQSRLIHNALNQIGIQKPILVGHSWSGSLVMNYAIEYPEEISGLVILSGYVLDGSRFSLSILKFLYPILQSPTILKLIQSVIQTILNSPLKRFILTKMLLTNNISDYIYQYGEKTLYTSLVDIDQLKNMINDLLHFRNIVRSLIPFYKNITAPIAIITCDSDWVVKPKENAYPLHKMIDHSKLIVVQNGGHLISFTQPKELIKVIHSV